MKNKSFSVLLVLLVLLNAATGCKKAVVEDAEVTIIGEWWADSYGSSLGVYKYVFDRTNYTRFYNFAGKDSLDCETIEIHDHNSVSQFTDVDTNRYKVRMIDGNLNLKLRVYHDGGETGLLSTPCHCNKWHSYQILSVSEDEIVLDELQGYGSGQTKLIRCK